MTSIKYRSKLATALAASVLLAGALTPAAGARPDIPVNVNAAAALATPDTRDGAGDRARPAQPPYMRRVESPVAVVQAEGVDWVSAALGAASGAGLVLLVLGAATGVRWWTERNRTTRETARA